MNWSRRIPARPPRRTTNPYPIRFIALCGQCSWRMGSYDLDRAEGAAAVHPRLTGHEGAEVVRAEEAAP